MRICVATPLYPPDPGGPATYAKILETELPKRNIPVTLVKFGAVRHYPKLIRHIVYFFAVLRAGKSADAILALDPASTGFPAALAAQLLGKPFIVKIVGDYAWEQGSQRFGITDPLDVFVRKGRVPFPVAFLRAVQMYVARSARRIIVPSTYLKTVVRQWGIPEDKIEVIYNAMQTEAPGAMPPEVSTTARPHIVTVGRLVPWKHVDGVIDAVSSLSVPATLIVVGDGPERSRLEARALERLAGRTVFTGALAHANTLAVLKDADIFVLNSSYEGLSHLLIEALSLGVPIVTTRVGGNPELVSDEQNGLLIPVGDTHALTQALERMLADGDLRRRLSGEARKSAERFSIPAMIDHTQQFLTSIV